MADEELKPVEIKLDPAPEPKPDESKPTEVKVESPDGIEVLKAQLAALEKSEKQEREARVAEREAHAATDQIARQREQELAAARAEADAAKVEIADSHYQVILNSIEVINRDAEMAQRDYAASLAGGNFEASAEAQRRIARAEAQLLALENGKSSIEERAKQLKDQPARQPPPGRQQTPTEKFETYLNQFSPRAQDYLRSHPEFATDVRLNNKLLRVHGEAIEEQGLQPDSDAYYRYIDERMVGAVQPASTGLGRTPPAAPVSRTSMSSASPSGTVTLSPAEREAARIAGVPEVQYARQMLDLQASGEITRH